MKKLTATLCLTIAVLLGGIGFIWWNNQNPNTIIKRFAVSPDQDGNCPDGTYENTEDDTCMIDIIPKEMSAQAWYNFKNLINKLIDDTLKASNPEISSQVKTLTNQGEAWGKDDVDYSVERHLKVKSRISNEYRFDILKPPYFYVRRSDGENVEATNYNDTTLIVREEKSGKPTYAENGYNLKFLKNKQADRLSNDYVVIREWNGGGSCCIIFHVFQTKPTFKKLLEHNNDFFDATQVVIGPYQLELHNYKKHLQPSGPQPHSNLKYNPSIYDLKRGCWIKTDKNVKGQKLHSRKTTGQCEKTD